MNFLKTFLAALLAVVVAFGLMIMVWSAIIAGIIASFGSSTTYVADNSVLKLNPGTITDAPAASFFDEWDFASMAPKYRMTQLSAVRAIQAAATDDRIEGIYIEFDEYANASLANLEEIRAELVKFKESGKFIIAYSESFGQIDYYVSSVADKIYINPEGIMEWHGLSLQMMFYKGLLDKLGIVPEVIRHGSFKSAAEPFLLDKMSYENRMQYEVLVGSLWGMITEAVAQSRGISAAELNVWADRLAIDSPQAAVEKGLVDGTKYKDEVMSEIAGMLDGEAGLDDHVNEVSFGDYAAEVALTSTGISRNKIAVVYAEGDIVSGEGAAGQMGSTSMVEKIVSARKDETVKAVVLRVNSPGGSALASDVMWRELTLLKAEKPVIVSMGAYAASGGYYIACPADVIYADRSTITGSIGVFGMHANIGDALNKHLGITVDGVTTNRHSDIGSLYREISPVEKTYIQNSVEQVYTTFIGHVAEGRNMPVENVDKIAQGRVWTGADAVANGLVDGMGGIADAITIAADRAGIAEDYSIWEVTNSATGWEAMFGGLSTSVRRMVLQDEMGEAFVQYDKLRRMLDEDGVQARLPYVLEIR